MTPPSEPYAISVLAEPVETGQQKGATGATPI